MKSLKLFHTFKINITAKQIIIVRTVKMLIKIWKKCKKLKLPFLLLGEGSNVIFTKNYEGIVVINRIIGISTNEQNKYWLLHVYGGTKWHSLVKYTLKKGIYGLENLALIPGTVGAAPIQNIGAYGVEFKDICNYVDILFLNYHKIIRIYSKYCSFSYRHSALKEICNSNIIILAVGIKLSKIWNPILSYLELQKLNNKKITANKIFHYICCIRKNKIPNPKKIGNAGSFFKNPIIYKKQKNLLLKKYHDLLYYPQKNGMVKLSARWLIEQCKLKGYSIGGVEVYKKQALILINKNNSATSEDIIQLTKIIQTHIKTNFNIDLEPEVQFINETKKIEFSQLN